MADDVKNLGVATEDVEGVATEGVEPDEVQSNPKIEDLLNRIIIVDEDGSEKTPNELMGDFDFSRIIIDGPGGAVGLDELMEVGAEERATPTGLPTILRTGDMTEREKQRNRRAWQESKLRWLVGSDTGLRIFGSTMEGLLTPGMQLAAMVPYFGDHVKKYYPEGKLNYVQYLEEIGILAEPTMKQQFLSDVAGKVAFFGPATVVSKVMMAYGVGQRVATMAPLVSAALIEHHLSAEQHNADVGPWDYGKTVFTTIVGLAAASVGAKKLEGALQTILKTPYGQKIAESLAQAPVGAAFETIGALAGGVKDPKVLGRLALEGAIAMPLGVGMAGMIMTNYSGRFRLTRKQGEKALDDVVSDITNSKLEGNKKPKAKDQVTVEIADLGNGQSIPLRLTGPEPLPPTRLLEYQPNKSRIEQYYERLGKKLPPRQDPEIVLENAVEAAMIDLAAQRGPAVLKEYRYRNGMMSGVEEVAYKAWKNNLEGVELKRFGEEVVNKLPNRDQALNRVEEIQTETEVPWPNVRIAQESDPFDAQRFDKRARRFLKDAELLDRAERAEQVFDVASESIFRGVAPDAKSLADLFEVPLDVAKRSVAEAYRQAGTKPVGEKTQRSREAGERARLRKQEQEEAERRSTVRLPTEAQKTGEKFVEAGAGEPTKPGRKTHTVRRLEASPQAEKTRAVTGEKMAVTRKTVEAEEGVTPQTLPERQKRTIGDVARRAGAGLEEPRRTPVTEADISTGRVVQRAAQETETTVLRVGAPEATKPTPVQTGARHELTPEERGFRSPVEMQTVGGRQVPKIGPLQKKLASTRREIAKIAKRLKRGELGGSSRGSLKRQLQELRAEEADIRTTLFNARQAREAAAAGKPEPEPTAGTGAPRKRVAVRRVSEEPKAQEVTEDAKSTQEAVAAVRRVSAERPVAAPEKAAPEKAAPKEPKKTPVQKAEEELTQEISGVAEPQVVVFKTKPQEGREALTPEERGFRSPVEMQTVKGRQVPKMGPLKKQLQGVVDQINELKAEMRGKPEAEQLKLRTRLEELQAQEADFRTTLMNAKAARDAARAGKPEPEPGEWTGFGRRQVRKVRDIAKKLISDAEVAYAKSIGEKASNLDLFKTPEFLKFADKFIREKSVEEGVKQFGIVGAQRRKLNQFKLESNFVGSLDEFVKRYPDLTETLAPGYLDAKKLGNPEAGFAAPDLAFVVARESARRLLRLSKQLASGEIRWASVKQFASSLPRQLRGLVDAFGLQKVYDRAKEIVQHKLRPRWASNGFGREGRSFDLDNARRSTRPSFHQDAVDQMRELAAAGDKMARVLASGIKGANAEAARRLGFAGKAPEGGFLDPEYIRWSFRWAGKLMKNPGNVAKEFAEDSWDTIQQQFAKDKKLGDGGRLRIEKKLLDKYELRAEGPVERDPDVKVKEVGPTGNVRDRWTRAVLRVMTDPSRFGKFGIELGKLMERWSMRADQAEGYAYARLEQVKILGTRKHLMKPLNTVETNNLNDIMDWFRLRELGRTKLKKPPKAITNEVASRALLLRKIVFNDPLTKLKGTELGKSIDKAAAEIQDMLEAVALEATEKGVMVRSPDGSLTPFKPWSKGNYYPVFLRDTVFATALNKLEWRKAEKTAEALWQQESIVADIMQRHPKMKKDDLLRALENDQYAARKSPFWANLDSLGKNEGHLEYHRVLDTLLYRQWDPGAVLGMYFRSAYNRLKFIEFFGQKGHIAKEFIEGAKKAGHDWVFMKKLFDVGTENSPDYSMSLPQNSIMRKAIEVSSSISALKLGLTQFLQITQVTTIPGHTSFKAFGKAIPQVFVDALSRGGLIPQRVAERFVNKELRNFLGRVGAMRDAEHIRFLSQMSGFLPELATNFLDITAVGPFDRMNRRWASIAGGIHVGILGQEFAYAKKTKNVKAIKRNMSMIDELFTYRQDRTDMRNWEKLTPERQQQLREDGGWVVSYRTQFRTRPMDLPMMASHPLAGPIYRFSSFAIRGWEESLRFAARNDRLSPWKNRYILERFARSAAVTTPVAVAVQMIRQAAMGKTEEEMRKDPRWQQAIHIIGMTGAFAWLFDWIEDASNTWSDKGGVAASLLGVIYSSWTEGAAGFANAAFTGDSRPLRRVMWRQWPNTPLNLIPGVPTRRDILDGKPVPFINKPLFPKEVPGALPDIRRFVRRHIGPKVDETLWGPPPGPRVKRVGASRDRTKSTRDLMRELGVESP